MAVAMPPQEVGKRTGVSTTDVRAGIGIGEPGAPMFTLQATAQHGVAVCATGETTHALTSSVGRYASEDGTGRGVPTVAQAMAVRRLTPTECERLQGFPDGWTAEACLPDGTIKQQADGPRYKQLGNAVTVNVAKWIAKRLAATLTS